MEIPAPYLAFAVICDHALIEQDGTLSLIRVVDTLTKHRPAKDRRQAMSRVTLAVCLKAGDFSGRGVVRIRPISPTGKSMKGEEIRSEVDFAGGNAGGAAFVAKVALHVEEDGLYWFDIYFDERHLTRVPLLVASSESTTPIPDQEATDR